MTIVAAHDLGSTRCCRTAALDRASHGRPPVLLLCSVGLFLLVSPELGPLNFETIDRSITEYSIAQEWYTTEYYT
jgi:hypothetical protein